MFEYLRGHGYLSVECCVLSGRDHCHELITRSREVMPIVVCRRVLSGNLKNEDAMARVGPQCHRGGNLINIGKPTAFGCK